MQLLAELLPVMVEDLWKRKMVHTIMDTIQFYAPPPCENRIREVQRLVPTSEEKEEMFMSDEDTLSKELNAEWRFEYAALAAEIAAEIAAGGPRKKRKKKYKDSKVVAVDLKSSVGGENVAAKGNTNTVNALRSSVKSSRAGRAEIGNVSFVAGSEDASSESSDVVNLAGSTTAAVSRQGSRVRNAISRNFAESRSAVGAATTTNIVPMISFSKTAFQSGVFQSGEFNLSSRQVATPKSWRGDFVSRRFYDAQFSLFSVICVFLNTGKRRGMDLNALRLR